jgi:hypothetical protein
VQNTHITTATSSTFTKSSTDRSSQALARSTLARAW